MSKNVLSVGQCFADGPSIARHLKELYAVTVREADSSDEAVEAAGSQSFDLVLINRILDETGEDGVALIKRLKQDAPELPVALVSNFADAQQRAIAAGATMGFGKNDLGGPSMRDAVAPFLADNE